MPNFRAPGELAIMKAVQVDDQGKEIPGGAMKMFIFDLGTERYVYTDPGKGMEYLQEVRTQLLRRRKENN